MSSNFIQSGNQSNLENLVESTDTEELDDAALRAVSGGFSLDPTKSVSEVENGGEKLEKLPEVKYVRQSPGSLVNQALGGLGY